MVVQAAEIRVRRDTAVNWIVNNPILGPGEFGFETDTGKGKYGNGAASWTSLTYAFVVPTPGGVSGALGYTPLNPALNLADISDPAAALQNLGGIAGGALVGEFKYGCWRSETVGIGELQNYMVPDGREVSRTLYYRLFEILGTTCGAGNGTTTFNIPTIIGAVTLAAGMNNGVSYTLGQNGGSNSIALSVTNMPTHNHNFLFNDPGHSHAVTDPGHSHTIKTTTGGYYYQTGTTISATGESVNNTEVTQTGLTIAGNKTGITASLQSAGLGTAFNSLPSYFVATVILKVM